MNITSLFKTVRSPDGTEMKSNFPSFFPEPMWSGKSRKLRGKELLSKALGKMLKDKH